MCHGSVTRATRAPIASTAIIRVLILDPLETVIGYVTETTGLALSAAQRAELRPYLATRMALLGVTTAAAYIARLADPGEFRALIDGLTTPETYFYRFEVQFDAFRDVLLPDFRRRALAEGRPVRLWSAGCCTGEEAYTLAIIASEAGCADEVEILATDINEGYLEAAMAGEFSRRSVDKLPASIVATYFSVHGDRFVLRESLRRRVTFRWLNLADTSFPSFLNNTAQLDMIFCRNVLIYFEKARVRAIIEHFADCLCPDGVLALGHSEMLPRDWRLTVGQVGSAFFYHNRSAPPRPLDTARGPLTPPPAVTRKAGMVRQQVTASPPRAQDMDPPLVLAKAERLADQGNAAEAARLCRDLLAANGSLVRAHYLLGLLELAHPELAHEHFRKVVYLDPGHLQARLHLAQCAEKTGRMGDAIREYRNLERLARTKPPEDILDPAEGITYGMLALLGRSGRARHGDAIGGE